MKEGVDSSPQTTEAQSDTRRSRSSNSQVRKATHRTCVLQPLEARFSLRLASRGAMTHSADHCDLLLSLSPEGDSCSSGDCFSRMSFCSISFPPSLDFERSLQSQSAANAGIKQ